MSSRPRIPLLNFRAGALSATGNRGLNAAVDHLSENEGKPIPDPSSVSSATVSAGPAGGGDPMQEDEDLGAGGFDLAQAEAEAKVRPI